MKKLHLLGVVFIYLGGVGPLHAVTIDFNSASTIPSGGISNGNPYVEDGFAISTDYWTGVNALQDGWQSNRGSSNGTTTADVFSAANTTVVNFDLVRVDGGAFTLGSIDLAELFNNGDFAFSAAARSVAVTGTTVAGGTVSATLDIDLVSDGIGGVDDFQTFSFGTQWVSLLTVNFRASRPGPASNGFGTYINFDNIVASAHTPIPPAVWLFGSGLLGLVGMARRKKA
jgi:hypothetical protein